MTPATRHVLLAAALVATVVATLWGGPTDDAVVAPAVRGRGAGDGGLATGLSPSPSPSARPPAGRELDLGTRPSPAPAPRDLFAAFSWEPPPRPLAAAPVAVAPEPPQAPPPTFTYIGRLQAGGRKAYLFLDGGRTLIVGVGDRIGDFRLDAASASDLTFTHLPTGLPVTVAAPSAGDVANGGTNP
ncbi:MAG TPA: hypothetical protein VMU33_10465 [Burkholderiaceae bacterium]|nr:hypothetical protein [Burkholderiaceae bacterium]